ncbi:MAG: prolipoprotein diacylglyceryl transferase [Pseudomonadota bacterium]
MPYPFATALTFPAIDPVIIQIGPLAVHWYGLSYVVGILIGWWFARHLVSTPRYWSKTEPETETGPRPPITRLEIDDFLTWAVVGIIAGGRLGYVLFYNLPYYAANPLQAFAVWDGGMSFHGGALGSMLAMVLFARARGFSAFSLMDVIAVASCFGLFFGRIANFINAELWGRTTDMPWAFVFPGAGPLPRHPSQLYEALLEGLLLFVILFALITLARKLATPGFVSGAWVFGYGSARIFVEFFREPDAHIGYLLGGWLTMGMVLSVPMLLIGAWAMATAAGRKPWRTADPEAAP